MWIFYSIFAGLVLACFFNTSKALKEHEKRWGKFVMASGVLSVLFIPFAPWDASTKVIGLGLGAGFAYSASNIPFFLGYSYLNPLTAVVLAALMPAFTGFGAWAILGEKMTPLQFGLFSVMLSGSLFAAFGGRERKRDTTKGIVLMLLALCCTSVYNVLTRIASEQFHDLFGLFALNRVAFTITSAALLLIPRYRRQMLPLFISRQKFQFIGNDALITTFVFFVIFAIGVLPKGINTGFVNVAYYAVGQIALFIYFAVTKRDEAIGRKAVGASVAFAGLCGLVALWR